MEPSLLAVPGAACASLIFCVALVATTSRHGRFSLDVPGSVQTTHATPAPRIGGMALFLASLIARGLLFGTDAARVLDFVLLAAFPALAIGLLEDITRQVKVSTRLAVTLVAAGTCCIATGVAVSRVDAPWADAALQWGPAAVVFTAVAVAGAANAINIIDGFHGLASGTTALALGAIGAVALQVDDVALAIAAGVLAASIVGFWIVNFPWGKLFLGDGGAYFAGTALAWLAILLPWRNPSVSPWAGLLICAYPVIEVLYSMARRWGGGRPVGGADRAHLHSLVASRLARHRLHDVHPSIQHAAVSALMWICAAIPALVAVTFSENTPLLAAAAFISVLLYHSLYRRVARP